MCEDTTYHKTEGIIRLAIEELLSKVSRLRCERDECAIDHAVTRSPSMTRDALHPVRCFLLLICIGPSNGLVMEQQEGPDDMMSGVDDGPSVSGYGPATALLLCGSNMSVGHVVCCHIYIVTLQAIEKLNLLLNCIPAR